jgi:hypothetical protein
MKLIVFLDNVYLCFLVNYHFHSPILKTAIKQAVFYVFNPAKTTRSARTRKPKQFGWVF